MGDHLRITPLAGLVLLSRSHDIMGAPPPDEAETRLFLEEGDRKLVVFAVELHRKAGADLVLRYELDGELAIPSRSPDARTAHGDAMVATSCLRSSCGWNAACAARPTGQHECSHSPPPDQLHPALCVNSVPCAAKCHVDGGGGALCSRPC